MEPLLIGSLRWQIDEVPGTCSGSLSRREQAARRGFKNRYIEDVSNADDLERVGALIGELALECDQIRLRESRW